MQSQAFGSGFEGLEDRLLLAGNITSVLAAGVLTLTGDAVANEVELAVGTNGQMVAKGLSGTTINGLETVNFGVINTLTVLGGMGDDKITLNQTGSTITHDVTINGGDGNDTISVTGKFGADLIVLGGIGNDTLRVTNTLLSSAVADINMDSGDGNDTVTISASKVGRDVIVQTGLGNDTVTATGLTIASTLSLQDTGGTNSLRVTDSTAQNGVLLVLGVDNDTVTMTNVTSTLGKVEIDLGAGNNVLSISQTKALGTTVATLMGGVITDFGDGIRVISGVGNDTITMSGLTVTNNLSQQDTGGTNSLRISNSTSQNDVLLALGAGNDTVTMTNVTSSLGKVEIDLGAGNNVLSISQTKALGTTVATVLGGVITNFGDGIRVISGLGNDSVTMNGLAINNNLSVRDTGGTNSLRITDSTARSDVFLTLGVGNDALTMTNVTALGKVDINLGDGNNLLSMSKTKAFGIAPSTLLVFGDGIRVISGTGTDKIGIIEGETAGVIRIDAGDGTNRVELTRVTTTTRLGTLDIVTGAGADGVTLDRISIGSDSVIDTGLGDDIFTLKNSRLIGDFDASLNDGNDLAYVGSNVFTSIVSYTFNGGLGGATLGFDTLRLGANTPVNLAAYLNFEVTLLATF